MYFLKMKNNEEEQSYAFAKWRSFGNGLNRLKFFSDHVRFFSMCSVMDAISFII